MVTEEELTQIHWSDKDSSTGMIDTYMDTNEKEATDKMP